MVRGSVTVMCICDASSSSSARTTEPGGNRRPPSMASTFFFTSAGVFSPAGSCILPLMACSDTSVVRTLAPPRPNASRDLSNTRPSGSGCRSSSPVCCRMTVRMFHATARAPPPKNHAPSVTPAPGPVMVATVNHRAAPPLVRVAWARPIGPRPCDTIHVSAVRATETSVPSIATHATAGGCPHRAWEIAAAIQTTIRTAHGGTRTPTRLAAATARRSAAASPPTCRVCLRAITASPRPGAGRSCGPRRRCRGTRAGTAR